MVFLKAVVAGDIAVKDFGGCPDAASGHVVIFQAKLNIGFLFADGVLRHFQRVPNRDTIGEEVAAGGLGHIAQGTIGGTIVKPSVMGDNSFYIVRLAERPHMIPGGENGNDFALSSGDLCLVLRPLFGVVRRIEQPAVSTEHLVNNEAEGLVYMPMGVVDTAAEVVHHGVLEGICGLRVDGQIIGFTLVNHWKKPSFL